MTQRHAANRTRRFAPLLIAGVLAGSGCAADAGSGEAARSGARTTISADEIRHVGSSELLSVVRDIEIADDGTLWVLNDAAPFFVAFDSTGAVIASGGRQGDGPGEFGNPMALVRAQSGIWAFDTPRHALRRIDDHILDETAEPAELRLPRDSIPPGRLLAFDGGGMAPMGAGARPWIHPVEDGFIIARAPSGSFEHLTFWNADVLHVSLTGEATLRATTSALVGDPESRWPGARLLLPFPIWAGCPDGTLVLYDPQANRVRHVDGEGADPASVELPPERRLEFSPDRLYALLLPRVLAEVPAHQRPPEDELRQSFDEEIGQATDEFADVFPEYAALHCAADGTIWLQHFAIEDGRFGHGWSWTRLRAPAEANAAPSPEEIRLPEGFIVERLRDGRAWGIVLDEFDVPTVAWTPLPR